MPAHEKMKSLKKGFHTMQVERDAMRVERDEAVARADAAECRERDVSVELRKWIERAKQAEAMLKSLGIDGGGARN